MKQIPSITDILPFENRVRVFRVPPVRMIGKSIRHENETSIEPIPLFWKDYHGRYAVTANRLPKLLDTTFAMVGEYNAATKEYTYMICVMCPADTPVPEGFEARDLPSFMVAHGPASDHPPDAHDTERFTPEVEALGFSPGGHVDYGFEFYPYPDANACCLLFEVVEP